MFKKCLTNKKPLEYSTELKKFACTLLFYSTPAYKYVRESFNNTLPHPQTVRRWFSTVNFSPGINKSVLINIKNMIESERSKDKELQFGMQVDEMSLKKQIEFKHGECYGLVDIGGSNNTGKSEEASYALVFMLVCLNGHFKTPIAYYFVRSLSGEARANILKELLITLHENGISDVRSITFDGAATNSAMVSYLGANIKRINEDCFFEHPVTQEPVYVVPDACHALKLVRNTFAGYTIYDRENNVI